jgi:hypothetical protein
MSRTTPPVTLRSCEYPATTTHRRRTDGPVSLRVLRREEGMARGRDTEGGRPVAPGVARAHGNDPDAVEVRSTGDREGRPTRVEGLGPDILSSGPVGGRESHEEVRLSRGARLPARVVQDHEGSVPITTASATATATPRASPRRDSIRWGPIWAGLITALTTFLLLQLLAIGIGLVDIGPGGGGGWVPAIIGLIAFFTGGAVAGMTSAVRGVATGLLNGFMVWALGTVLILLLSALGLGQLFGALGNVAGQLDPGALSGAADSAQSNAPNVDPQQAAQAVRTGAIGAFFGLLLSALTSALGGYLGGRSTDPIGRPTDIHRD